MAQDMLTSLAVSAARLASTISRKPVALPAPIEAPDLTTEETAIVEKPIGELTRYEGNRRRFLRDAFGAAPYGQDTWDLSHDLARGFREADNGLATMIACCDPDAQDRLTGCVQVFLNELLQMACEGPGEPTEYRIPPHS